MIECMAVSERITMTVLAPEQATITQFVPLLIQNTARTVVGHIFSTMGAGDGQYELPSVDVRAIPSEIDQGVNQPYRLTIVLPETMHNLIEPMRRCLEQVLQSHHYRLRPQLLEEGDPVTVEEEAPAA